MRAVNLIPADQRRGAGGLAGRSGGIVYVVAGGLLVVVAMGIVYAFAVHSVADRKGRLASVTAQVDAVTAQTAALAPFQQVALLREAKVAEVLAIAEQRFNWPTAMQQVALSLPADVTLTKLTAGTAAATSSSTVAGATPTLTAGGPQFVLTGCSNSQAEVSTVLSRLQRIPHVVAVNLANASKSNDNVPNSQKQLGANEGEAAGGTCPNVTFNLSLSYDTTYTIPNQKLAQQSSGAKTVSTSPAGAQPAANAASTKVTG